MARDMESGHEKELFSMEGANFAWSLNFVISPDRQQLALASFKINRSTGETVKRILTVPKKGGEPKELHKTNPRAAQLPTIAWTPDGKFLLFTDSLPKGGNAVFIIAVSGGEARELCRPQTIMHSVLWSVLDVHPDGKRIAFDCFEYRHEVWAMENFLPSDVASAKK